MSSHILPEGLTRGYSHAYADMICEAAAKSLTIPELNALDEAEIPVFEPVARVE